MTKKIAITINAELSSIDHLNDGRQHILPPTYPGLRHNLVGFDPSIGRADMVLIDSKQSMANRVEEALASLGILPEIVTDVSGRSISINDMPARAYDAILRDSQLDGVPWRQTEAGGAIAKATPANATALYEHAPLTLLLGGWDSFTGAGGSGAKFPRALSAEIWGNGVQTTLQTYARIDPLGIESDAGAVEVVDDQLKILDDKVTDKTRPSNVGHGNIVASDYPIKGVWVDGITLTASVSINQLNRLSFPREDGSTDDGRDAAGREVLLQLGLVGLVAVMDNLSLRSGCDLVTTSRETKAILSDGTREEYDISNDRLDAAIAAAETHGLKWAAPINLTASAALAQLADKLGV